MCHHTGWTFASFKVVGLVNMLREPCHARKGKHMRISKKSCLLLSLGWRYFIHIHCVPQKVCIRVFAITWPNLHRFSKFFHILSTVRRSTFVNKKCKIFANKQNGVHIRGQSSHKKPLSEKRLRTNKTDKRVFLRKIEHGED